MVPKLVRLFYLFARRDPDISSRLEFKTTVNIVRCTQQSRMIIVETVRGYFIKTPVHYDSKTYDIKPFCTFA